MEKLKSNSPVINSGGSTVIPSPTIVDDLLSKNVKTLGVRSKSAAAGNKRTHFITEN